MSDTFVAGDGDDAGTSAASKVRRDVDPRTGHEVVAIDPETEIGILEHDGETLAQACDHRRDGTAVTTVLDGASESE